LSCITLYRNPGFFRNFRIQLQHPVKGCFLPIFRGKAFESILKKIGYVLNGNCW
jgi:hypothetical protein